MFLIFVSATFANDVILQEIRQDTSDINSTLKGMELFLSDKENYKTYCSAIKWVQPELSVYVEKGTSQLPSECVSLLPSPIEEDKPK